MRKYEYRDYIFKVNKESEDLIIYDEWGCYIAVRMSRDGSFAWAITRNGSYNWNNCTLEQAVNSACDELILLEEGRAYVRKMKESVQSFYDSLPRMDTDEVVDAGG